MLPSHVCDLQEMVGDFLKEGQQVRVKVLEVDDRGRVRLSMKALLDAPAAEPKASAEQERTRRCQCGVKVWDTPTGRAGAGHMMLSRR